MLLLSKLGVKPAWLLGETGNSVLEADPRIPPNPKKKTICKNISSNNNIKASDRSIQSRYLMLFFEVFKFVHGSNLHLTCYF